MENPATTELSANPPGGGADMPPGRSPLREFLSLANKYFFVFLGLLIGAAAVTIWLVHTNNKKAAPKTTAVSSLTSQQIATLKGSTTLVGDSQETLDVQSNSVFEGQVLLRNNLDVAGTIKVGGSLSLSSLTIGGAASFGQIQVNGTLGVTGNSTFQDQVNIQKSLSVAGSGSFGSLSTGQLNVSSLQLTGDLAIAHHLVTNGGAPAKSNGSALGGGGTASISGNDTAGTITINTGNSPPAGCFVSFSFTQKFAATPHVIISPSNSSAGSLDYYTNRSNTGFSVCDNSAPAGATTYTFDYFVAG